MDHLTLEAAFWLAYRWSDEDLTEWREYPDSGRFWGEVSTREDERFYFGGWSGMSSLQIIFWF